MQVALADDEEEVTATIGSALREAGIVCDIFASGRDLVQGLKRSTYDVVLADWNMPSPTGIEVIGWAMENMETPPAFIMMTSRSAAEDIVRGLEAGACDYIVKPEDSAVILARINAAARRDRKTEKPRAAKFGNYVFDHLAQSVALAGEPVKVTAKEFALAELFFENRNRPMSRGYLLGQVWGSSEAVETRTLDMHVSRIRSKLALRPENGFVIQSIFGFGYRLDGFGENVE